MYVNELIALEREGQLCGQYDGIDSDTYHDPKCPGISKSSLDLIRRSPAHYLAARVGPKEQTDELLFGSLVHDWFLLGDEYVEINYAVRPDIKRTTKAGKQVYQEFLDEHGSKDIISADMYERASIMVAALRSHPTVSRLIDGAEFEQALWWRDPITNVLCKCKPDILCPEPRILIDLKTTVNASYSSFRRSVATFGYDKQAAFYLDGVSAALGTKYESFLFVAVEKRAPFGIAIYNLREDAIEVGREKYRDDLEVFKGCLTNNEWPGYSQDIQLLDMPQWAFDIDLA